MRRGVATIGLVLAMVVSVAGTAAATPGVSEDVIPSPQAMVLHGTHGYEVLIDAYSTSRGRRDKVVVSVSGKRDFFRYVVPANLANEGIRASLGRFGRIDMRWVPDGHLAEVSFACHGHGFREHFLFDRGAYVGTLRFRGGDGFTAVRAHRVEFQPSWYDDYSTCHPEGGEHGPSTGKILRADLGRRHPSARFAAYQPRPGARVLYEGSAREAVGRVKVERTTWAYGAPRTLTTSPDFASATIEPPAPFTGTASFARTDGEHGTWTGDLSVAFPDGSVAPMAGAPFKAAFYSEGEAR